MLAVAISPHRRLWGVGVRSDVLTIWWIKDDWWCGPVLRTGHLNLQANVGNMKLLVTQALLISYNLISIMLTRLRTNADYHLRCYDCVRGKALILETSRRRPHGPLSIPEICYHSSSFSLKPHYFLQSAGNNVPSPSWPPYILFICCFLSDPLFNYPFIKRSIRSL